ncbi:MAG TPA: autotransporter-associated beta strand repeat-containing protein, partial [Pirellulales bacterium]
MRLSVLRLSSLAALCVIAVSAQAQTWSGGGGTNNFNNAANWDTLPTNGSSISFGLANGNLIAPKYTLNNDFAALTLNAINFNSDSSTYNYTLNGNAITMTAGSGNASIANNSGTLQTINVNIASSVAATNPVQVNLNNGNLTIGGVISGTGGWQLNGPGTLTLNAANTYTGTTTVNSGVLLLNNANAVASSTVSVNSTNGLAFASGIGTFNVAGLGNGSGNIALSDTTGNQNVNLSVGGTNASSTFNGSLTNGAGSGVGSLTKVGTGTFTLSGTNSYTGITTVSAGTLGFTTEQSFYNGNSASWTSANFVVASGATLALSTGGFTGSDIQTISAQGTGSGGFLAGSTLGLDTTSGNFIDSNSIGNAGGNGLNISKLGANTLTLTGANTYTGTTTVNAGILQFALRSSFYSANMANWTANN